MSSSLFRVETLTSYDIDADGKRVQLRARDPVGQEGGLDLPFSSIRALMMALPLVQQKALFAQTRDRSLRVAYDLSDWALESCHDGKLLLSIATTGGYSVSIRLDPDAAREIGTSLSDARVSDTVRPLPIN